MATKEKQNVDRLRTAEATVEVSRTVLGQESSTSEKIKVRPFVTFPAWVQVSLGRTIKTGDFESARVQVSLEVPCYREELLETYRDVLQRTIELLNEEEKRVCHQYRGEVLEFD